MSTADPEVIRPYDRPLMAEAGLAVLSGNLFDAAVMKTCVIGPEFRARYLSNPSDPDAFEGRAVVFEGPEDYRARIDDPALAIDERCILVIRNCGPAGYPGSAEVVNMRPPKAMIQKGVHWLPCIGDGRQSGTSASPSILNASPEAAVGGGLSLLRSGDRIRIDLKARRVDMLVAPEELERRRAEPAPSRPPPSQTPWQELHRELVGQLAGGGCIERALSYQDIARRRGLPRHSH